MKEIIEHLQRSGEQTESQIATALRLPLAQTIRELGKLRSSGEVISCDRILVREGKETRESLYRAQGYIPPKAPGPKPK